MDFLELIKDKVVIGDGAMGTRIYEKGVPLGTCYEKLNLTNAFMIKKIHSEYLDAGAELIETNTFQANRLSLKKFNLEDKVKTINKTGCKIATDLKKKYKRDIFVAGSVGPLSNLHELQLKDSEVKDIFKEQVEVIVDSKVDLIILETFTNLKEIQLALQVVKTLTDIPVIAEMAYFRKMNFKIADAITTLEQNGADVIGVNCTRGPNYALKVVEELGALTDKPISAFPNAGLPEYVDGRYMYLTTPEYFLTKSKAMINAGANIIGGCCGTEPKHIKMIADKLKNARPVPRQKKMEAKPWEAPRPATPIDTPLGFIKQKEEQSIVVEVDPPRTLSTSRQFSILRKIQKVGVDAITIGDNPLAVVRLGHMSFAKAVENMGLPTIVHMSCRDRNLIALQSAIMEAHFIGIRSILVITGDPAKVGNQPNASSIYDLNSFALIKLIRGFNNGVSFSGDDMKTRTSFLIGCAFNPNKQKHDNEIKRLAKKIESGADFALTQPVYDKKLIEKTYEKLNKHFPRFPVYIGILPPVSFNNASFLANEVPGVTIPSSFLKSLENAPKEKHLEICREYTKDLIKTASDFTNKYYFIQPLKTSILLEMIKYTKSLKVGATQ